MSQDLKQVGKPIQIKYLEYQYINSAGAQIKAFIDQEVPCVEFTMKKDHLQTIMQQCTEPVLMATEPFVQFEPDSWKEMINRMFTEMVDLWNEKHGSN